MHRKCVAMNSIEPAITQTLYITGKPITQPDGNAILEYGDMVVVDNILFLHRFDGGQALAEWLDSFAVTLIYLSVYSPELIPIELVFTK